MVRKALEFSPQLLLHSRVWDHNQEWHRVLQQHRRVLDVADVHRRRVGVARRPGLAAVRRLAAFDVAPLQPARDARADQQRVRLRLARQRRVPRHAVERLLRRVGVRALGAVRQRVDRRERRQRRRRVSGATTDDSDAFSLGENVRASTRARRRRPRGDVSPARARHHGAFDGTDDDDLADDDARRSRAPRGAIAIVVVVVVVIVHRSSRRRRRGRRGRRRLPSRRRRGGVVTPLH